MDLNYVSIVKINLSWFVPPGFKFYPVSIIRLKFSWIWLTKLIPVIKCLKIYKVFFVRAYNRHVGSSRNEGGTLFISQFLCCLISGCLLLANPKSQAIGKYQDSKHMLYKIWTKFYIGSEMIQNMNIICLLIWLIQWQHRMEKQFKKIQDADLRSVLTINNI